MKHLEDTPWWICDPKDTNYCAYVDTDSNYFNAEPLLKHLYSNFDEMSDEEKDTVLEKEALKYQDIITKDYDRLAKECFNVNSHRLEMKTECVIRSAYFRATRRYAQWITKQEGLDKETLDIKGLEFMKANFPPILGEFFNSILKQILKGETIDALTAAGAPLPIVENISPAWALRSVYLFSFFTAWGLPISSNGISLFNILFLNSSNCLSISILGTPFKTCSKQLLKNLPNTGGKLAFLNSKPLTSNDSFSIPSCLVIHCA